MPNITGALKQRAINNDSEAGIIYPGSSNNNCFGQGAADKIGYSLGTTSYNINAPTVTFNATNSNNLYGASNTVQPPALSLVPQIKY